MGKLLRSREGFSLIELLAAMLVLIVIAGGIMAVMTPTLLVYMRANDLSEMNTLVDNIANEISNDISMSVTLPKVNGDSITCEVDGVRITYSTALAPATDGKPYQIVYRQYNTEPAVPLFDVAYYKRKQMELKDVSVDSTTGLCKFAIIVLNGDGNEFIRRNVQAIPVIVN